MLPNLPDNALVTADAGFVGYEYVQAILASGRQLLLRVGANVKVLKKLGYAREFNHTVYLWPDRQAQRGQPPLVLRLVVAHNGKHPVYLLTSVLSPSRLSDAQVIELYARRWGIELFYRHLKQTFQRRKLRSASAENARVEMEWSLAGLWAMALYALVEREKDGISPPGLSVAQTLRAFRRMLRDYLHPAERGRSLRDRLRMATIDPYERRSKDSRDYPRKKRETPPGPPQ
ncbi:MAG: transposase, partial [Planctomycetes bacterium]|nr:transposase [Planctomycetota bacterium]